MWLFCTLLGVDHGAKVSTVTDLVPGADDAECFVDDLSLALSALLVSFEGVQEGAAALCAPILLGDQGDIVFAFSVGSSVKLVGFVELSDKTFFGSTLFWTGLEGVQGVFAAFRPILSLGNQGALVSPLKVGAFQGDLSADVAPVTFLLESIGFAITDEKGDDFCNLV